MHQQQPGGDRTPVAGNAAGRAEAGQKTMEHKLFDLKAYRRSRGLCDNCGEKWSRDHKCADMVGIRVLEEMYALFSDTEQVDSPTAEEDEEQLCLCVATSSEPHPAAARTLQFRGQLHSVPVLLLLDSGSNSSFISKQVVDSLSLETHQCRNLSVQVANGEIMCYNSLVPKVQWSMGQYQVQHDLKVLSLSTYDIILGMDWLQLFSPMKVDWRQQWLAIPYQGTTVYLHGVSAPDQENTDELVVQLLVLSSTQNDSPLAILPEIQQILDAFPEVTTPPTEPPPQRACDHSIPLVDGARPVNVQAYRYPLALKDEIETQVETMLQQGLIQPSNSPFNSPVLLVRKKDKTWRFCVDYRYLNALTVKTSFPIPVFEQLMDELAGAQWFSTLDLLSGYHQIRLKPVRSTKPPSLLMSVTTSSELLPLACPGRRRRSKEL